MARQQFWAVYIFLTELDIKSIHIHNRHGLVIVDKYTLYRFA